MTKHLWCFVSVTSRMLAKPEFRKFVSSGAEFLAKRHKATAVAAEILEHEEKADNLLKNAKPFEAIPGRKSLPIIGTTYEIFTKDFNKDRMHTTMKTYAEKYGPIYKFEIMGMPPMVVVNDPADIEKVLQADGKYPYRPTVETLKYYRDNRVGMFEHQGLILTNGKEWQEFRSKVQQPLMKPQNMLKYIPLMETVSIEMVERIRAVRNKDNETPEDFLNEMFKWALESVALVALDVKLGALRGELAPGSEPQQMIDATVTTFQVFQDLEMGGPPLWKIFPSAKLKKLFAAQDTFVEISLKYINQAYERVTQKKETEPTILEAILARGSSLKDAVVMVLDMLMAGIDTTSSTQSFLFYHLARNQDKQEKLRNEIRQFLPKSDSRLTTEALSEMHYLKACIKESLRLTPAVTGTVRIPKEDIVVGGYKVPKGCWILLANQYISTLETYYKEADKFIPERWLKGHELESKGNPYVTLPFGFGTRMCVGRRIAEQEMWLLTTKVLQQMRIEWHHGELDCLSRTVNTPDKPLKFKFIDL